MSEHVNENVHTQLGVWIGALRLRTVPVSIVPVLIGSALAFAVDEFVWWVCIVAVVCSMLIQFLTGFVNEIYDARKGADTGERVGPARAVAQGLISERAMIRASVLTAAVTFALGMLLVARGGWAIFLIGVISLFCAYAYTGGAFPLAYNTLGDVFAFVFFGVVAVVGTYFAHAIDFTRETFFAALFVSFVPAAHCTNILAINNLRDLETDRKARKITFPVRFGARANHLLFVAMTILAFVSPLISVWFYVSAITKNAILSMEPALATPFFLMIFFKLLALTGITVLPLPMALRLVRKVFQKQSGAELFPLLADAGKLLAVHGVLVSLVVILWRMVLFF